MQLRPITHFILFALALTVCLVCARVISSSANTGQKTQPTPLQGEAALTHLKQQGQYDSLQEAMQQARYTVQRANTTPLGRPAWHAPNSAAGYDGYVTEDGVSIALKDQSYVSLTLRGIGYGYSLQYVGGGEVSGDKQSLTIKRDGQWSGLKEWYVNGEGGLEQGFTLNEPPGGSGKRAGQKLRLALSVNEDWRAVARADSQSVTLLGSAEGEAIDYSKLVVWDANGSPVKAALLVEDERVIIEVDDAKATYPLTIDPVFTLQQKITAGDGTASDRFGSSVALDGNLAVVGSYTDDIGANADQGAAYVFIRQGAVWSQQAKLVAADGAPGDFFGYGVAVSGETVVVGAFQDDVTFTNQGSAYVFTRSGTTWTQQAKLTANDAAADDGFGYNVGISGDTVVIGAYQDDVTGVDQGSAYVFTRTGLTWSPQQKLIADDGAAGDLFGYCVTISGDTVAVGAVFDKVLANVHQGSAYVFTRSGASWMQQQHLNAPTGTTEDLYGGSISLSGNTLAVGAYQVDVGGISNKGTVYVYTRSGLTWSPQAVLIASDGAADDLFGSSVALSGNTLVVGAIYDDVVGIDQGSAYVFTRSGATWTQQFKLTAADGASSDFFGTNVAVSGDTVMVGANGDDVGANADQGSVYFFRLVDGIFLPQTNLVAADGAAGDNFGFRVAVTGDTLVVGAYTDNVGMNNSQGSAYVFVRSGATWTQQQKLTAANGAANDMFGFSVALSGDSLVVGAIGDNSDQGSAYVFVRSGTTWTPQQKLTHTGGAPGDLFGYSAAISLDTAVVGAEALGSTLSGAAFVFVRSGTTWTPQKNIIEMSGDILGSSVALSGNTLVVGAQGVDSLPGSAYVYTRNGTTWELQQRLTAADGVANDKFGSSVGLSGDTVVVGAYTDDVTFTDQGSAYVFTRSGTTWSPQQKLTASDAGAIDRFGWSLALSGDSLVVGASGDNSGQGSAYVFTRSGQTWTQQQKFTAADGAANDSFGLSVALSDDTVVVGAPSNDVAFTDQGSAYVFTLCRYDLGLDSQTFPAAGGTGSFTISCGVSCPWTAAALPSWITITSNASGTGNGTITFNVAPNSGLPRSSSISVNGSSFAVSQEGTCPLTLIPTVLPGGVMNVPYNQTLSASGGNGVYSFQLANGTTLPLGLTLSSGGVISGTPLNGNVGNSTFTVAALNTNGCTGSRTYTINIAACAVSALTPNIQNASSAGGNFTFTVTAPGCTWSVLSSESWLTVTQNPSGTGNLVVGYSVAANPGAARTGLITINNLVFIVNQDAGAGLQFYPLAHPVRLLDTRAGATGCDAPGAMIPGQSSRTQTAAGRTCDGLTIPSNAKALTGNITTVQSGGGFLTLYPSGVTRPLVANSNFAANQVLNNVFTVGLGASDGAFNIFVTTDTNVVVDITGYYAPPSVSGLYFHPLPHPVRLLDSRAGQTACFTPGALLNADSTTTQLGTTTCDGVLIPAGALALVGNATTVGPQANGFLTLFPANATRPLAASSNFQTGINMNAPFTVGLSPSGEFNIYTAAATNLVVDVLGYYSAQLNDTNGQGLLFNPLPTPVRLLDTRAGQTGCFTPGAQMIGGTAYQQPATGVCTGIPVAAKAVVGNATTVNVSANGFLTFWPSDATQPNVATSNYRSGTVFNRHFTVGLGADGGFKRFAFTTTDLVIDLSGYFAP